MSDSKTRPSKKILRLIKINEVAEDTYDRIITIAEETKPEELDMETWLDLLEISVAERAAEKEGPSR